MKSFSVTFQNGSFLEEQTGKRIIPQQGSKYILAGDDDAFATEDPRLVLKESINPVSKLARLAQEFPYHDFHHLCDAGETFYFALKLVNNVSSDDKRNFYFQVLTLEPLYLMKSKQSDGTHELDWRLASCAVRLVGCPSGNLILTEKIEMPTFNALYAAVIQFYFAFQRSTSSNSFKTFYRVDKSDPGYGQVPGTYREMLGLLRLKVAVYYKFKS